MNSTGDDSLQPQGFVAELRKKHHGQTPAQIAETFFHMKAYGEPTDPANHPLGSAIQKGYYGYFPFRLDLHFEENDIGDDGYHQYFVEMYQGGELALRYQIVGPLLFFMEHFLLGEYNFLRPGWRYLPARVWHRLRLKF